MSRGKHSKTGAQRSIMKKLAAASSTCIAAALVFALGLGIYGAGMPTTLSNSVSHGNQYANTLSMSASDEAAEVVPYASLPQEDYATNTVLVPVSSPEEAGSVTTQIASMESITDVSANMEDIDSGFVTITYTGNASSGQVADQLNEQGFEAQPNFRYYALEADGVLEGEADAGNADAVLNAQAVNVNDTHAGEQWGLGIVRAYDAWGLQKCRPDGGTTHAVSVAIIDSGCNVNHPDLKNNIVGTYDTRTGGKDVTDDQNHGTPVAGIIAAEPNNGIGVAGVSYNAGLYIVRALHKQGNDFVAESSDILKAYENVIANKDQSKNRGGKIRVVNMSLGSKRTGELGTNDKAVMAIIDRAFTDHDLLTVTAAGNKDGNLPYRCYPCDFSDNVIGVINLRQNANAVVRNEDSNYNMPNSRAKQLSAPGTGIYTTSNGGNYVTKTGTSMAAPCVSGIAALAFAANPQLSADAAKSVLISAADDINQAGFDAMTGYGKINAYSAVQLASGTAIISGPDSVYVDKSIALSCPQSSGWTSSNTSIATVNDRGVVKGVKAGYVTISVKSGDKTVRKSIGVYDGKITGPGSISTSAVAQYKVECSMDGSWSFELAPNSIRASITKGGTLTTGAEGQVTIIAKLDSNPDISIQLPVTIAKSVPVQPGGDDPAPEPGTSIMYRLYNPNSGEHFYTASIVERNSLIEAGWDYEGRGWTAPENSKAPVYRLYNANAGDHHYTTSAYERDHLISVGWNDEGIGWYSDDEKRTPLYRQYNPNAVAGAHNYTTSTVERDHLISVGWNDEGIGWYGL